MSSCCNGGCRLWECTSHHRRSHSLAVQWGCAVLGSADCSCDDLEYVDGVGGGGFLAGCVCNAFASNVGHGAFGTPWLDVVNGCSCWTFEGVMEEGSEIAGYGAGG